MVGDNGAIAGWNDCIFLGFKMVGDTYVPVGKQSTQLTAADSRTTLDTIHVDSLSSRLIVN